MLVEVAPDHLDRPFDYAVPEGLEVRAGQRVEVVFSGRKVRGLVVDVAGTTDVEPGRIRELRRALGDHVWVTEDELAVLRWAGERFAAPVADVVRHALPDRVVDVERRLGEPRRPTDPAPPGPGSGGWERYGGALAGAASGAFYWRPLPGEDVGARLVELAGRTLAGGRDVLVVVAEPVSAAADAVVAAYGDLAVDVRGDLSPRRTYRAWLAARRGEARVVVGERRVAFWPLERLGLAVVVDESNPALKERRSPRHHAREVVLERARRAGAVAVLVGTVPSAAAWRLLAERRLSPVTPDRDAERAAAPVVLVDERRDPRSRGRIGTVALRALRDAVAAGAFGVVLASRRGEGRALVCTSCGERVACPVCASSLPAARVCEGCGWRPDGPLRCVHCGSDRHAPLAAGAERYGAELARSLPDATVAVLEGYAQPVPDPPAVLVTTRGSVHLDPPGPVRAVVVPDLAGMLRRPALDAAEDALRLVMRLGAWLPARDPGAPLVVETREPDHHAVQALVRWDPGGFWRDEAARRAELRFPPTATAIRLDVATDPGRVSADLRAALPASDQLLGPVPADGRSGLLVKSADRPATLAALAPLRAAWARDGLDVRIDVDPVDVT